MMDRMRRISSHRRTSLKARWSLCATSAGTLETAAQLLGAADPDWLPIDSPDTVAGALRGAGHWSLDGPLKRFDKDDWWFRAVFDAPLHQTAVRRSLAFGGLAGECSIWLNGELLLTSDNMHVAHDCAVGELLAGENELLMRFASLDARLAQKRPRPRWRAPMIEQQQLRWTRVSVLGRTPGWSPPAPVVGPWRAIEWIDRDCLEISSLRLRADVDGEAGRVDLSVDLTPVDGADPVDEVTLRVSRDGILHKAMARSGGAPGNYVATLEIPDVTLWWPHTHGDPALYEAELVIRMFGSANPVTVCLGRLGFRTLTVDTEGGEFAVRVNDVPVFCRGANWTPLDVVSPAASAEAIHSALAQVQTAGLNMLRVNGCMVYEGDDFFEACDALGVLVWQDFMFANMDFPATDEAFLASVQEEVSQHLARWQAHPSLAVICGNSEAEQQAAMWGASRETWSQPLFDEHLAALAREFCPGVTYWPSSAHGGAFPHQNDAGTTSYYGVGAYLRPMEDARRAGVRFATECLAFANVPPVATIARMPGGSSARSHHPAWKARTPRDLGAGWDFEDVRDHYLQRLYGVDPVALRSTDYERYLQLSRAVSADVIQATMSEWRRPASTCRGALVWFLRDLWAGAGWGLLDERGTPKAAFHGLRRASAPIHLFLTDEGTNGLALHVINDPSTPLAASIEVTLYRDDGLRMQSSVREIAVAAHGGQTWPVGEWFDGFIDVSGAYRFGPGENALIASTLRDTSGQVLNRAFFCPGGLPATRRHDVGLEVSKVEKDADGGVIVAVSAQSFAHSVHFDAHGYLPEDEYFHLAPGETFTVRLIPSSDGARLTKRISVLALNAWSRATFKVPQ